MIDRVLQCLECAARERQHAHFLFRSAARDPLPPNWHIEHRNMQEGRFHLREAIKWIWVAKDERERARYADDMRKLRQRSPGQPEVEPDEMALHET
jgi:hypothetical protein